MNRGTQNFPRLWATMETMLSLLIAVNFPLVSAWVVGYNPVSVQTFERRAAHLDRVFTEYYTFDKAGNPTRRTRYKDFFAKAKTIARKNKTEFYVMINNYGADPGEPETGFDPIRMAKTMSTEASRRKAATQLVEMVLQDQADGVDLDIESLKAEEKDRFSAFVATLSKLLKAEKKKLSVTVHPKTESKGNWDGPQAQDYAVLGKVCDVFNIMTYDYTWAESEKPGPISPNNWVEQVITYTKSVVETHKIGLGIACYGYDWTKKPATSTVWDDVKNLKLNPHDDSGELASDRMRFGGAQNFENKVKIAQKHGLGSIAFWYCGSEDPKIWDFIAKH